MEFLSNEKIYQWDLNKVLGIMPCAEYTLAEVHFQHCGASDALVVEIYEEEGKKLAKIPNIFLQSSAPIKAWLTDGEKTICGQILTVIPRAKPADYVYTETEVKRYEALESRIKALERNGGGGGSSDLDVQINGTSIVADGVANIPLGGNSELGVFAVKQSQGTWYQDFSGYRAIQVMQASEESINNRIAYRAISPNRLDYAVKAAMCDGKGAEWTGKEKQSARDRLGITELLEAFVNAEEVAY